MLGLQICLAFDSKDIEFRLRFYTCLACILIICNCLLQVPNQDQHIDKEVTSRKYILLSIPAFK